MKILVDSHLLLWVAEQAVSRIPRRARVILEAPGNRLAMSAASFWELALKTRKGKLKTRRPIEEMALLLEQAGFDHLPVTHAHGTAQLASQPANADPFDHLLLAQCQVEAMKLLTLDKALLSHPLVCKL